MRKRSSWIAGLFVAAVAAAPLGAHAADAVVGGKGPRIRSHDGRRFVAHHRPVFVVVDSLGQFGQLPAREAPPLEIQVQGDVEITPLPDGGLRIRFLDEDE